MMSGQRRVPPCEYAFSRSPSGMEVFRTKEGSSASKHSLLLPHAAPSLTNRMTKIRTTDEVRRDVARPRAVLPRGNRYIFLHSRRRTYVSLQAETTRLYFFHCCAKRKQRKGNACVSNACNKSCRNKSAGHSTQPNCIFHSVSKEKVDAKSSIIVSRLQTSRLRKKH